MTVRCCSAPRIVKFEYRFITTVDVAHNLALLAGLLAYLHTFTHALVHAHRLTLTQINNHTIVHSPTVTCTHALLYAQPPHKHANMGLHARTTYTFTQEYRYSIHTYTHAFTNTCLQYNTITRTHTHTHNSQIPTQIHF